MNTTREAEVVLKVNSKEAQDKLERLQAQAKELRERFADAFRRGDTRGIEAINKDLIKVNKEISLMRTNAANIRAAMTRLDQATPRELQRTIKLINNELNSGRVRRGSKEWDEYIQKLRLVQGELAKVKRDMQVGPKVSFLGKIKNGINGWGATAAAAAAAFGGVVMSGKAAVQAYADMEAEEANVRKYTGMTAEQVAALNEEFKKMDTRTSREDLNKLAQEAGRLGKTSTEDVLGFVRAADQINVALDDLGEGATLTLSKLTGIFGDEATYGTEKSLLKVGSVINELSQNCSASAPYLAEFSSRIGGIAAQSKMTISDVMAFAAVLDTQNLNVEASSTAVGQLITKIYQEPAKMARAAGLDVKKFSEMVKTDMNGALVMLFEHLNQFGGMEILAKVFDNMGTDGARAIPVLTALAGHVDELKRQQSEANKAFAEGTSVSKEFDVQNNTVQAGLDKAKKAFNDLAVDLGKQLLPVMRYCISGTSLLMRVMSGLISFFIQHRAAILALTSAIVAYNVAANWAAIKTAAFTATSKLLHVTLGAVRLTTIAVSGVFALFSGNVSRASAAIKLFSSTIKANPIGLFVSLITSAIVAVGSWINRVNNARKAEQELAKQRAQQAREFRKQVSDISTTAGEYAKTELDRLKKLYDATQDQTKSQKERIAAVKELQKTYPSAFGNLSQEKILAGEAASAYDTLATSIIKAARAKAAAEKIKENEKLLLDLDLEREDVENSIREDSEALDKALAHRKSQGKHLSDKYKFSLTGPSAKEKRQLAALNTTVQNLNDNLDSSSERLEQIIMQNGELERANERLAKVAAQTNAAPDVDFSGPVVTPPEGDGYVSETLAEKKAKEAQKKAKEALKKDLDERKSLYIQAEAENSVRYYTGAQDYAAYLAKKEQLETEYADDVIKIHQQHDQLDKVAYAQALKDKADLLKKHEDEQRKPRLQQVEADHRENTDAATMSFYDPSSDVFQNQRLLNQMLFQEDIRYLNEKAALYKDGSEERAKIEQEIADRTAKDQLDKQKETAEALVAFEQQYRRSSGSVREQNELAIMAELHQRGLISEEEYQRAVNDIKDKYRREDIDKARTVQSEYADMVMNLTTAFKKFFDELGQDGTNFWDNLSNLASSAFAVMSSFISQFSAYASAERDLELAKTEKRYDKEIQAAGKNTKKKEKLEKQKEADLARIKKKYNDKEMKMQLAQAVAQTAVAAINAYASGSKVNVWLGPVAAALATAAGMVQIATIKKQHEAQAAGYYEGGFTARLADDRREVGVVHANEFVANHQAVANPALAPVLRLIDTAQRNNTVGSLTAADVSNAIGQGSGVSARGEVGRGPVVDAAIAGGLSAVARSNSRSNEVIGRLSDLLDSGIEAKVILDGEDGFHKKYTHYKKLIDNPKR